MNGFNLSEAGHCVALLTPQSISGGKTAQAFAMKGYAHASIVIVAGAEATQDTSTLVVNICSDANGDSPVAIPFNYYYQTGVGAGNDVLSAMQSATSAGLTLSSTNFPAQGLIIIEIDDAALEGATGGVLNGVCGADSYVQVVLGAPSAVDYATIIAVLSGARNAQASSPSVTV